MWDKSDGAITEQGKGKRWMSMVRYADTKQTQYDWYNFADDVDAELEVR